MNKFQVQKDYSSKRHIYAQFKLYQSCSLISIYTHKLLSFNITIYKVRTQNIKEPIEKCSVLVRTEAKG